MQNIEIEEHFEKWPDLMDTVETSNKKILIFNDVLVVLRDNIEKTLNSYVFIVCVNCVYRNSLEKYPILNLLVLNFEGNFIAKTKQRVEEKDLSDLKEALVFFLQELKNILFRISAGVVDDSFFKHNAGKIKKDDKLIILSDIGELLVRFESVESDFPKVLERISNLFSFQSITLLQKNSTRIFSSIWFDPSTSNESLQQSYNNAEALYKLFDFDGSHLLIKSDIRKYTLPTCLIDKIPECRGQYLILPLVQGDLQNFGIIQFEMNSKVIKDDLPFFYSLANILSVALDRLNKKHESENMYRWDLSEFARRLEDAHRYTMKLENEREMREQFVATLTHDLRTPLTAVKMGAQCILRRPENSEHNQQAAVRIIRNIERMDQMVRDLLDASRIRAGEPLLLTMNLCDLHEIVLITLRELVSVYGNRIVFDSQSLTILGYWNEDGIRRVIENLISNAVKYGSNHRIITLKLEQNDEVAKISVHNFGNPIPYEDQSTLFEPFQRSHSVQKGIKKGWGLGLTIVKGIVEAHGGQISVSSNEPDGTNFIVELPKDSRPFQILN